MMLGVLIGILITLCGKGGKLIRSYGHMSVKIFGVRSAVGGWVMQGVVRRKGVGLIITFLFSLQFLLIGISSKIQSSGFVQTLY